MTSSPPPPGGTWTLGDRTVTRFGYGAMQLAGPGVLGPPLDRDAALATLRAVVAAGITHLDTSDAYGPRVVNELVREALHPYPQSLVVATKVGADRDRDGGWPTARTPDDVRRQVHDNLASLGVDALDLVYLRMGDAFGRGDDSLLEPFEALAAMQAEGLVRHLGVSNVTADQVAQARGVAHVVAVQNLYNLAHRDDDALIDELAAAGIAYVPFFPLGGFTPLQSQTLGAVAARHGASARSVALAWLLRRSPNILVIAGTSSSVHLLENLAGAGLELTTEDLADLDGVRG